MTFIRTVAARFLQVIQVKLEMLACLRAGQRDGRHRQTDYDFGGWVKTLVLFLEVSERKFMKFWDDVGDTSYFPMPFPDCVYHAPCWRYWPSKLPLSYEVVENG